MASNLILTRLLFPEVFGLMALVTACMVGMAMFSDVGITPAIMQNKRGDEPDFLNTAWTIQVIRGVLLWLSTFLLAYPLSVFYGEELLLYLLPAAGLTLIITGFNPTRIATADRHLIVGRVVFWDIVSQGLGVVVMVLLAWQLQSIWALIIGMVTGSLLKVLLMYFFLPGLKNSFHFEAEAARDLINFGKWIFLSTASGFLILQGDKIVLGKYISLHNLGIYNIAYFLASFR